MIPSPFGTHTNSSTPLTALLTPSTSSSSAAAAVAYDTEANANTTAIAAVPVEDTTTNAFLATPIPAHMMPPGPPPNYNNNNNNNHNTMTQHMQQFAPRYAFLHHVEDDGGLFGNYRREPERLMRAIEEASRAADIR